MSEMQVFYSLSDLPEKLNLDGENSSISSDENFFYEVLNGGKTIYIKTSKTPVDIKMSEKIREKISIEVNNAQEEEIADLEKFLNSEQDKSELSIALQKASVSLDEINLLLAQGEDVNQVDSVGFTPLMYAMSTYVSKEIVRKLLEKGADPNAKNWQGDSVIFLAAVQPSYRKIKLLLEFGADINQLDINGRNCLYRAQQAPPSPQRESIIKYLEEQLKQPTSRASCSSAIKAMPIPTGMGKKHVNHYFFAGQYMEREKLPDMCMKAKEKASVKKAFLAIYENGLIFAHVAYENEKLKTVKLPCRNGISYKLKAVTTYSAKQESSMFLVCGEKNFSRFLLPNTRGAKSLKRLVRLGSDRNYITLSFSGPIVRGEWLVCYLLEQPNIQS